MSELVELTVNDYLFAVEMLKGMGYSIIKKKDKGKNIFRLGIEAPRPIKGSEVGFFYSNNNYTSIFWLSFLFEEEKFRDKGEDALWLIITQGDELVYSAKPIARKSKADLMNALRYAWVNKWKIDNIPLCPCCHARMVIFRKRNTRCYMYTCKKIENHPDGNWQFLNWDYGLKENAKAFVEIRRTATARYKEKMKALGKSPIPAAVKRKKWKITKESNLIKSRF